MGRRSASDSDYYSSSSTKSYSSSSSSGSRKFSLTLLSSDDWSKNGRVLAAATKASEAIRKRGAMFECCESFGGNTLNLRYPYLHLSRDRVPLKERLEDALTFSSTAPSSTQARMEQAEYEEVDTYMPSGDDRVFRLEKAKHLIYIGLRIKEQGEATAAEFESGWRRWSKADVLLQTLRRSGVSVSAVAFLRQSPSEVSAANINLFTYSFLVAVKIRNKDEKISCLNVLQKLRGSLIPGYVSLFERSDDNNTSRSQRDSRSRRRSDESLERLLQGVEALSVGVNTERDERHRSVAERHLRHFSDSGSRNIGGEGRRPRRRPDNSTTAKSI